MSNVTMRRLGLLLRTAAVGVLSALTPAHAAGLAQETLQCRSRWAAAATWPRHEICVAVATSAFRASSVPVSVWAGTQSRRDWSRNRNTWWVETCGGHTRFSPPRSRALAIAVVCAAQGAVMNAWPLCHGARLLLAWVVLLLVNPASAGEFA